MTVVLMVMSFTEKAGLEFKNPVEIERIAIQDFFEVKRATFGAMDNGIGIN